jgi:hypothetical protein
MSLPAGRAALLREHMTKTQSQTDATLLRRYLLGQADPEEQSLIEQRLMTDQQYFAGLLRLEENLIDEYACEDLGPAEKQAFERYFVNNPARYDAVEFTKTVKQYVSAQANEERHGAAPPLFAPFLAPWLRKAVEFAAACALLLAVVATVLLYRQTVSLKGQLRQMQARESGMDQQAKDLQTRTAALAKQVESDQDELNALRRQHSVRPVTAIRPAELASLSFVLSPGLNRAPGQNAVIAVSSDIRPLRLELDIADQSYKSYRAELQTVEGEIVRRWSGLRSQGAMRDRRVVIMLPPSLITRSDYLIVLKGENTQRDFEKVGSYYFKAVRK